MVMGLWGCALPRAAILASRVPVPELGAYSRIDHLEVLHSLATAPWIRIELRTPRGPRDTMEWYREKLLQRGWVLDTTEEAVWGWYGEVWSGKPYTARHRALPIGETWLISEELTFYFERHRGGEGSGSVMAQCEGDYAWDWPGKGVFGFFFGWAYASPGYSAIIPAAIAMPLWLVL
jgi:hypothetical protein